MSSVEPIKFMNASFLKPGQTLPLVLEPKSTAFDLTLWVKANLDSVEASLLKYGAILFRNTGVKTQHDFERFIGTLFPEVLQYIERSTPRTKLSDRVYTSTEYPPDRSIALHNESSYSSTWPGKICFFCLKRADSQGETPIADVRNVYKQIDPKIVDRFIEKGWMLIRNYRAEAGLTWQSTFQTKDKTVVEEYCRKAQIECAWTGDDNLRTRQARKAVVKHPKTGETVWFSHVSFWHPSSLDPEVRKAMMEVFGEEGLPYNTCYGDGTRIEDSVIEEVKRAYEEEKVLFPWRDGDLLLVDNMLVAHGRSPFKGPRRILVAMAEPHGGDNTW